MIAFRSLDQLDARPQEFVSIVVNGHRWAAAARSATRSARRMPANKVVRYRLNPFRGFGSRAKQWCRGRYTGSASVMRTARSSCTIRPNRLPAKSCVAETKLGSFSFRVR